jgi:hypothetical protein
MMFQTFTSFWNTITTFIEQLIAKPTLNHLGPKKEEDIVNANNITKDIW